MWQEGIGNPKLRAAGSLPDGVYQPPGPGCSLVPSTGQSNLPFFFFFLVPPAKRSMSSGAAEEWNLLYGTLGKLNLEKDSGAFKSETCIWDLGEPALLRVDPVCGTWGT